MTVHIQSKSDSYVAVNLLKQNSKLLRLIFCQLLQNIEINQLLWYGFFNHEFWNEQPKETSSYAVQPLRKSICAFADTEEFIEDLYPTMRIYDCRVSCLVLGDGWRPTPLPKLLETLKRYLPHNFEIRCKMEFTNCPNLICISLPY